MQWACVAPESVPINFPFSRLLIVSIKSGEESKRTLSSSELLAKDNDFFKAWQKLDVKFFKRT
uniref:Uncharacterized protein n=1 Tax=Setaria italica TaxID=4555 RepID=K4AHS7_SETIT